MSNSIQFTHMVQHKKHFEDAGLVDIKFEVTEPETGKGKYITVPANYTGILCNLQPATNQNELGTLVAWAANDNTDDYFDWPYCKMCMIENECVSTWGDRQCSKCGNTEDCYEITKTFIKIAPQEKMHFTFVHRPGGTSVGFNQYYKYEYHIFAGNVYGWREGTREKELLDQRKTINGVIITDDIGYHKILDYHHIAHAIQQLNDLNVPVSVSCGKWIHSGLMNDYKHLKYITLPSAQMLRM